MNIKNNIKSLREEIKMSQEEFVELFDLLIDVLIQYENGSIAIPLEHKKRFANYFGVSEEYVTAKETELPSRIQRLNNIFNRKQVKSNEILVKLHKLSLACKNGDERDVLPDSEFATWLSHLENAQGTLEWANKNTTDVDGGQSTGASKAARPEVAMIDFVGTTK